MYLSLLLSLARCDTLKFLSQSSNSTLCTPFQAAESHKSPSAPFICSVVTSKPVLPLISNRNLLVGQKSPIAQLHIYFVLYHQQTRATCLANNEKIANHRRDRVSSLFHVLYKFIRPKKCFSFLYLSAVCRCCSAQRAPIKIPTSRTTLPRCLLVSFLRGVRIKLLPLMSVAGWL